MIRGRGVLPVIVLVMFQALNLNCDSLEEINKTLNIAINRRYRGRISKSPAKGDQRYPRTQKRTLRRYNCSNPNLSKIDEMHRGDTTYRWIRPYLAKVCVPNRYLRLKAGRIVRDCPDGDRECMVNAIYRYIVENYRYRSDPRPDDFIQSPFTTMRMGGGDCEDLSILLVSLLENIGIRTYLVLIPGHMFALACDLNLKRLTAYARFSFAEMRAKETARSLGDTVIVKDNRIYIVHKRRMKFLVRGGSKVIPTLNVGDLPKVSSRMDVIYSVKSNLPINIFVIPGDRENLYRFLNSDYFSIWTGCYDYGVSEINGRRCLNVLPSSVIAIANPNLSDAIVEVSLELWYSYAPPKQSSPLNVRYLNVAGSVCVVLDPTTGKVSYPGYYPAPLSPSKNAPPVMLHEWAIVFDPITGQYIRYGAMLPY